MTRLDWG